jgi:hypothetical protein
MVAKRSANELSEARGIGGTIVDQGRGHVLTNSPRDRKNARRDRRLSQEAHALKMDGLTSRKLFVDSRLRQPGGKSHDFVIELPESIEFPPGTHVLCSEALIPASWNTVDAQSGRLYLGETIAGATKYRIVELDSQPHDSESLRLALQNALNANRPAGLGTYSVTRSSSAGSTATAAIGSAAYRFYTITLSAGAFTVFPRELLMVQGWYVGQWLEGGGPPYNPAAPQTTEVITFETGGAYQSTHQTKYLDLRGRHTLFICSSLVNNDSVSVNNLRGVVAKVGVTEAYGGLINYQHGGNPYDLVSLRDTSVKRVRFWILDAHGQYVDLRGSDWSATLIFCRH